MKKKIALFAIAVLGVVLMGANLPENVTLTIDVSQYNGNLGQKLLACNARVIASGVTSAVCDASKLIGSQAISANTALSATNTEFRFSPNVTITYSPSVTLTLSGNYSRIIGGGPGTIFDGQAWTAGAAPKIKSTGSFQRLAYFQVIGDRIAAGDLPSAGTGGDCVQQATVAVTDNEYDHLILNQCGNSGITFAAADRIYIHDILVRQSSRVSVMLNSSDGLVHTDMTAENITVLDGNTANFSGNGEVNVIASGCVGCLEDVRLINVTVKNAVEGRTGLCNGSATLSARTGCGQAIQITDNVNNWYIENAHLSNSFKECIATAGRNGEINGGVMDNCNQAGGGGAGCIAVYSGRLPVTDNYNIHDFTCTDSGYGVSLLLGNTVPANQDGNVFRNINIHDATIATIVNPTTSGIRLHNETLTTLNCGGGTRGCNYSLQNVRFDNIRITDVTNPINYVDGLGGTLTGHFNLTNLVIGDSGTGYIDDCLVSGASPIQCGWAEMGTVTLAAGATTVTVNDKRVTPFSKIALSEQPSMAANVVPSVTANTTTGRSYTVTTQTSGTSFVITSSAAPVTNPAVISFRIVD